MLVLQLVAFGSGVPKGYRLPTSEESTLNLDSCSDGKVRHVDGKCVTPIINRRLFLYRVPGNSASINRPQIMREPKVERNFIFVRLPGDVQRREPVILPPAEQQYIVYVLRKQSKQDQRVVDVPAPPPSEPEVFFVNYSDGEEPTLPGGVNFKRSFDSAFQDGGPVVRDIDGGGGGDDDRRGGYDEGYLDLVIGFTDGDSGGNLGDDVDILTKDSGSLPNNPPE